MFNLSIPTHIIAGNQELTTEAIIAYLRQLWCKQGIESCFCSVCKQLAHRQHRFLAWIKPTKDYTVDDLTIIFQITSLALDEDQLFFFVLEQSEKLTPATANRLLKSLEEPPPGYHFVLLTENLNALLPTIISRAEVITLVAQQAATVHPLLRFFLDGAILDKVQEFEAQLQKSKLSDSASAELLDELFEQYEQQLKEAIATHNDAAIANLQEITTTIHQAMQMLPQSGSSDLFWKHLWAIFPRN